MPLKIFITGGTSGIGLELAKSYSFQGNIVGVCGRDEGKFQELAQLQNIHFYKADVSKKDEINSVVKEFIKTFGLDILIASAGLSFSKKTQIPNFEISEKIIDTNVLGVLYSIHPALSHMIKNKAGQIVVISSVAGFCGFPGVSAYSASKSAVMKLCEGYQVDLEPLGINTTCIAPGFVDTPLTQKNHHKMPFIVSSEKAAKLIMKAIEKKKRVYSFPWFFASFLRLLSILPRDWYVFIMKKLSFEYAK